MQHEKMLSKSFENSVSENHRYCCCCVSFISPWCQSRKRRERHEVERGNKVRLVWNCKKKRETYAKEEMLV